MKKSQIITIKDDELLEECRRRGWQVEVTVTVVDNNSENKYVGFCQRMLQYYGAEIKLPPGARAVAEVLLERFPEEVENHRLIFAMYKHRTDGGPLTANKILHQRIHSINKQLQETPYEVVSTCNAYRLHLSDV